MQHSFFHFYIEFVLIFKLKQEAPITWGIDRLIACYIYIYDLGGTVRGFSGEFFAMFTLGFGLLV